MDRAIYLTPDRWLTSVQPLQWSADRRQALRMDAADGMQLLRHLQWGPCRGIDPGPRLEFVHHYDAKPAEPLQFDPRACRVVTYRKEYPQW